LQWGAQLPKEVLMVWWHRELSNSATQKQPMLSNLQVECSSWKSPTSVHTSMVTSIPPSTLVERIGQPSGWVGAISKKRAKSRNTHLQRRQAKPLQPN
jgi:hypothetical protein